MSDEETVIIASQDSSLSLESFDEFIGTGVVPLNDSSHDLMIAVYVSRPRSKLSKSFREKIPNFIEVCRQGKVFHVPTCIVDVGKLKPY
ncbi:hypothetical protein [Novosphingobium sp. AAP93]|uniref:hypothetical protein n=1 Tax=Novosphingobium sp. AAP93 TaxID=1523427 RepID=UPI0012E100C4|nr:hypothetical protein [Novosphingobium sp. AAP93]